MRPITFNRFKALYQDSVRAVLEHWTTAMQWEIAAHCHGWSPGLYDFKAYLELSSIRFYKAYRSFAADEQVRTVCDVGGFWGAFPMTLCRLGYEVTMTESLQFYSRSFNRLFEFISEKGVRIIDYDPFQEGARLPRQFDVITVMAVLEHYPHSLKIFMDNVISSLKPEGQLYLEVPNIAYWPKRMGLLWGRTPLAPQDDIFQSKVPFIGHHHEYTISELRDLARLSGLSIISEDFYNYSIPNPLSLKRLLWRPVQFLAFLLLKNSRECLAVSCKVKEQESCV